MNLDRIGYWSNPGITWLAPKVTPLALTSTVQRLSGQLRNILSTPKNIGFLPHVTLFGNSRPTEVFNFDPVAWHASNLVVVESQLLPEGLVIPK